MRSKLISAMILIFTLVAMITTAFADSPISSSVLLDTTQPTSTGISFGAVADDNKVILTAAGLSDGTNGTGIKQVDWELKFGSDVVLTKSNTYTSPITGTVSEEYTITQRGSYTLTVTLTDWVNNSQTYTKTQNLSKIGSGYLTIDSWMQGEDPKVPQFGSSTNSTTGVVVEYKLRNAADSTYTTQGPVYEVADYTARVIFPETGLYDTLTITTNFAITPFTEAPNVHILKDTKAPTCAGIDFGALSDANVIRATVYGMYDGPMGSGVKMTKWIVRDSNNNIIYTSVDSAHTYATDTTTDYIDITVSTAGIHTLELEIIDFYGNSTKTSQKHNFETDPSIGNYFATVDVSRGLNATLAQSRYVYAGEAITPTIVVKDAVTNAELTLGTHYTITYSNNTNVGTATAIVRGKGLYKDVITLSFEIYKREITVTAQDKTKNYGSPNPTLTYTVTGTANGEVAAFNGTLTTRCTTTSTAGDYPITIGTLAMKTSGLFKPSNYTMKFVPGTLHVGTEFMTVNSAGYTGAYDGAPHGITVNVVVPDSGYTVRYGLTEGTYNQTTSPTRTDAGETVVYFQVTADGYNTYTGNEKITITQKSFRDSSITCTLNPTLFTYNGQERRPTATVKDGETTLVQDRDYTITYVNNINAGIATAIIRGIGNYTGKIEKEFTITRVNIRVTPDELSKVFGQEDPILTYTYSGAVNSEIANFNGYLSREPGEDVGQYDITRGTLILLSAGNFNSQNYSIDFVTGKKFTITSKSLNDSQITASLDDNIFEYDGTEHKPVPTILDGSTELINEVDFRLEYTGNKNVGNGTVTAIGINNYTGSLSFPITVTPRRLIVTPDAGLWKYPGTADPTLTYTVLNTIVGETPGFNGALTREPGEVEGEYEISQGTLALTNNSPFLASNYTFTVTTGRKFTIVARTFTSVTTEPSTFEYDGTFHTPRAIVYDGSTLLTLGTHYTVTYSDNKDAGTGHVMVSGLGSYTGVSYIADFTITPRPLRIKADDKIKQYNTENPILTYRVSNAVTGETPLFVGSLATTCVTNSPIGTYPIRIGTLTPITNGAFKSSNYEVEFTQGTLTVTNRMMDVVVTGFDGPYDGQPHGITIQVVEPVGLYNITYRNGAGNYTITTAPTRTEVGRTTVYFKISCDGYQDYYGNADINIYAAEFANAIVQIEQNEYIYNGLERRPGVTVVLNSATLRQGTDYSVTYEDNIDAGTAKVIVTGIGGYAGTGSKIERFLIKPAPLVIKPSGNYSKIYQDADPTFNYIVEGLQNNEVQGSTGKLSRDLGEDVGTYEINSIGTLTLTANGRFKTSNYSISFERNNSYLTINPRDISTGTATFNEEYVYSGNEITPVPSLVVNNTSLLVDRDFTITYSNNVNVGTAQVIMTGIGNYTGTKTGSFTISKANFERFKDYMTVTLNPIVFTYDGTPKEPDTYVTFFGKELIRDTDYTVSYLNNVEVGDNTAIAVITGIGNYEGTLRPTFSILPVTIDDLEAEGYTIELSQTRYEYDMTPKEPRVLRFVTSSGKVLSQGVDFEVTYEDNVYVGIAKVIITGIGHYSGRIEVGFEIYKTTPILTLEDKIVAYSGGGHTIDRATITKIYGYGGDLSSYTAESMLVYNYYADSGLATRLSAPPQEEGTYYVQAYLPGDANHNESYSNVVRLIVFGRPTPPIITGNDGSRIIPDGGTVHDEIFINIYGSEVSIANDVLIRYLYSLDGNTWFNYSETLRYTEGTITVYAKAYVVDVPTLVSDISTYTVTIDRTPPEESDPIIDEEQESVVIEIEIPDDEITEIYVTEDPDYVPDDDDDWLDVDNDDGEDDKTIFETSQGDGEKTLYIWERDKAGNMVGPIVKTTWLNAIRIGNLNDNKTNLYFKVTDKFLHTSNIRASDIALQVNGFDSTGSVTDLSRVAIQNDPNDGYKYTAVIEDVTGDGNLTFSLDKYLIYDRAWNHISDENQIVEVKDITVDNTLPILRVTVNGNEAQVYVEDEHLQALMLNGAIVGRLNGEYTIKLNNGKNKIVAIDSYGNDVSQELQNFITYIDLSSVPNDPELYHGMKALYYTGGYENVVGYFTDSMYSYDTIGENSENTISKWANARTEDGSSWVWIPRFAYKPVYYTDASMSVISEDPTEFIDYDVIFLRKRSSTEYIDKNGIIHPLPEGYIVADAFTMDKGAGYELTGFWISKYEISREDSMDDGATWEASTKPLGGGNVLTSNTIRAVSKADRTPWRGIDVSNIFDNAKSMNVKAGSRMMRNSEYEATLLLGLSEYGRNGDYIATDDSINTGSEPGTSTTGNIYGVFDMIGGSWEYTATYLEGSPSLEIYSSSMINSTKAGEKQVITSADIENFIYSSAEKDVITRTNLESPYLTSYVIYRGLDYTSEDMSVESIPVGGTPDSRVGFRAVLVDDGTIVSDDSNSEPNTSGDGIRVTLDGNGGTSAEGPIKIVYASSVSPFTLPSENTFFKDGYIIAGWSREADTSPTDTSNYYPVNTTTRLEEDTYLYAIWKKADALFLDGASFNSKIKKLAGNSGATASTIDTTIKKIEWTDVEPSATNKTSDHIVSSNLSGNPIYAWIEGDSIKLYTEASIAFTNANAQSMFANLSEVTSIDLSKVRTSKSTTFASMFSGCNKLANLDLSKFDTSNVTNMSWMFNEASRLATIDLENFDTSKVTHMTGMFNGCENATTINVSGFNTSKVVSMEQMFKDCAKVTELDVRSFDTRKVATMKSMFAGDVKLNTLNLSAFNTSNVTDMSEMFMDCAKLPSIDLRSFDTSRVTNMSWMFSGCNTVDRLSLANFNTSKVTNMTGMFNNCENATVIDVSGFNTSKVTNMSQMFANCSKVTTLDVVNFNTGNVTTMESMFENCRKVAVLDTGNFNTTKVTNMARMFAVCETISTLDLRSFVTNRVTDMSEMFIGCTNIEKILASTNFTTNNVTSDTNMFLYCIKINGGSGTVYDSNHIDKLYARLDGVNNLNGYFWNVIEGYVDPGPLSQHTIRYDGNGGTGVPPNGIKVFGSLYEIPNTVPTKLGSTFLGWALSPLAEEGSYQPGDYYTEDVDTTFYAIWYTVTYDVIYDANGGDEASLPEPGLKIEGIDYQIPNIIPTRDGFTFAGWGLSDEESTNITWTLAYIQNGTAFYTEDVDVVLYAKWTPNIYNITYDANGGIGGPANGIKYGGQTYVIPDDEPTRTDYIFIGWATSASGFIVDYYPGDEYTTNADLTLHAVWKKDEAIFLPGYTFNGKIKTLAAGTNKSYYAEDTLITGVVWSNVAPTVLNMQAENIVSTDDSAWPIYAWFENDQIKLYSKASKRFVNENAADMFAKLEAATKIEANKMDTRYVTNMEGMFRGAGSRAQIFDIGDLSSWDTSNVRTMEEMFAATGAQATTFKLIGLSNWDTSNVEGMGAMFAGAGQSATTFELDLSGWDTSNVHDMYSMFNNAGYSAPIFDIGDLSSWDTSNVEDMGFMFAFAGQSATTFELDLSDWDTSNVLNMGSMFVNAGQNATTFELDLSDWDTSNVLHMNSMFNNAGKFATTWNIGDLSRWNTSNVEDMGGMFAFAGQNTTTWNIGDLSRWNTSNVEDMNGMFWCAGQNATTFELDLSGWDTSNVENMDWMFACAGQNATTFELDLSGWDTSNVRTMEEMFAYAGYNAAPFELDLSSWDTSNVSNMEEMFYECRKVEKIYASDKFVTTQVTVSYNMFDGCLSIDGGLGTRYRASNPKDKTFAHLDGGFLNPGYFYHPPVSTTFLPGTTFNGKIKTLAAGNNVGYTTLDSLIKGVVWSNVPPTSANASAANIVSTDDSEIPIYAWYEDEVIKLYTAASTVYVNQNASYMFYGLRSATEIEMNDVNTINTTNMNYMFGYAGYTAPTFEVDLSSWDTSSVTNMAHMFDSTGYTATTFDLGDLSSWDTSKVTDMNYMFGLTGFMAPTFDLGDIGSWDTSKVTNMSFMYYYAGYSAQTFNIGDLSGWTTSNVTDMSYMFGLTGYTATEFDLGDLSSWDTSNVNNMSCLFYFAGYTAPTFNIGELATWDTSNVTNMSYLFFGTGAGTSTFKLDLSSWDTSNVTTMAAMLSLAGYSATTYDLGDLSGWNISNVLDMNSMFASAGYSAPIFDIGDLSSWDTSNVTDMRYMFNNSGYNSSTYTLDLSSWDTSNVMNMAHMFSWAGYNATTFGLDVSGLNTSKVTDMSNMFNSTGYNATTFELNLSSWDTSRVTNMDSMFYNCRKVEKIYASNNFVTTQVTSSTNMFDKCLSVIGGLGTTYNESNPKDKTYAHFDGGTANPGYFWRIAASTTFLPGTSFNSKIKTLAAGTNKTYTAVDTLIKEIIWSDTAPTSANMQTANIVSTDDSGVPIYAWFEDGTIKLYTDATTKYLNANSSYMFNNLQSAEGIEFSNVNTTRVTNMQSMFGFFGYNLDSISLDIANWDTSNVTTMQSLFSSAGYNASSFNADLTNWDTSSVTNMGSMFGSTGHNAMSFNLGDLSGWDTSNVTYMGTMFSGTGYKTTEFSITGLSEWDTSNVINMNSMFYCTAHDSASFNIDLSDWNVSKVKDMTWMFALCGSNATTWSIGDLSGWRMSSATTVYQMFESAGQKATTWNIGDLSDWDVSKVENMGGMFIGAGEYASVWDIGDISEWNTSNVTNMSGTFGRAGYNATTFDLDLSGWDTSKVTTMSGMFANVGREKATSVTLDLSGWDLSSLTNMSEMFTYFGASRATTYSIEGIESWDTSNVTNMEKMFSYALGSTQSFDFDFSSWDTSSVTNIISMFYFTAKNATSFRLNLEGWNLSNADSLKNMFEMAGYNSTSFELNVSNWNTSGIANMYHTFAFMGCSSTLFDLDLSSWDTSSVTSMNGMFEQCRRLEKIYASDNFVTTNVTTSVDMFDACSNIKGGMGTVYNVANPKDKTYAHIDGGTANPGYFWRVPANTTFLPGTTFNSKTKTLASGTSTYFTVSDTLIKEIVWSATAPVASNMQAANIVSTDDSEVPIYAWFEDEKIKLYTEASKVYMNASARCMFYNMNNAAYIDMNRVDTSNATDMYGMFYSTGKNGSTFNVDVSSWNVSNVTNMQNMFYYAGQNATTWSVGNLSEWNTANVTNMSSMFDHAGYNATTWTLGDLSEWDVSNVTTMYMLFDFTGRNATLWSVGDLSEWNISKLKNASKMFEETGKNDTSWSIGDLSGWDTSQITDMSSMFSQAGYSANTFTLGDLSGWDTSNVTNMSALFNGTGFNSTTWSVGDLSGWNTANVKDMSSMFGATGHSSTTWSVGDLSGWITSSVTNMSNMFGGSGYASATWSVGDISGWNTSNVKNMNYMFRNTGYSASTFDLDLSGWDTSSVTSMRQMFNGTARQVSTFDIGDISGWNTSNVEDMERMFNEVCENATSWNIHDLSGWDMSSVTNIAYMFMDSFKNIQNVDFDLSGWDLSNVTGGYMDGLFRGAFNNASSIKLDLSGWQFSNVSLRWMFYEVGRRATSFELDLSDWNTSEVTSMNSMFFMMAQNATPYELDLSSWDTSSVINMEGMFKYANKLNKIYASNAFVTTNVTTSDRMFDGCSSLVGGMGTTYNESNPKDKTYAHIDGGVANPGYFWRTPASATYLPGTSFNGKIKNLAAGNSVGYGVSDNLIKGIGWSSTAPDLSIMTEENIVSTFDSEVPIYAWFEQDNSGNGTGVIKLWSEAQKIFANDNMSRMFYYLAELTELNVVEDLGITEITTNVTNLSNFVSSCNKLASIVLTSPIFDTRNVTTMSSMFGGCKALIELDLAIPNFDTSQVTLMDGMFGYCENLISLKVNGPNFKTDKVKSMKNMFFECNKLETLDLSNFDTSQVTTMYYMFGHPNNFSNVALREIIIGSNFKTSNVTTMEGMFADCQKLEAIDVSRFDTGNVTNMKKMFYYCKALTNIDVSGFNTSKVTSMDSMFFSCGSLQSLNVKTPNFDTSNVTNMYGMFSGCTSLTSLDLTGNNFNTSNVTNMGSMFGSCTKLTSLNLKTPNFDTSNVTNMTYMFYSCAGLTSLDLTGNNFNTSNVTNMSRMFNGCKNMTSLNIAGTNFNTGKVTDMSYMFDECEKLLSLDLTNPNFDTSNVTTMQYMFYACRKLTNLNLKTPNFDTGKVTNMGYMFAFSGIKRIDLSGSNIKTSNVTDMYSMFMECAAEVIDISGINFDTSNVTRMKYMFCQASSLRTIYALNTFSTASVTNREESVFYKSSSLVGGAGTAYDYDHNDITYAHIDGGTSNPGYFTSH